MKKQTLTKLNFTKLNGMSRSFRSTFETEDFNQYPNDEVIPMLVDAECGERENRKLGRVLK